MSEGNIVAGSVGGVKRECPPNPGHVRGGLFLFGVGGRNPSKFKVLEIQHRKSKRSVDLANRYKLKVGTL